METGKLFLVATPIGNLKDISARALEVLGEADLIAAEDTRNTVHLLTHFGIRKPMTSYHEYNRIDKARELVSQVLAGKRIAVVTDAGMPAISDPGEDLVRIAAEMGAEVTIIPGACACVSALALSALPTRRFCFEAFLPAEKRERQEVLKELAGETRTIVLYEAPHRLQKTLAELCGVLGEGRRISLVRELTKKHEEVVRMTLGEAAAYYGTSEGAEKIRGEYVLVIEGKSREQARKEEQASWEEMSIEEHVAWYEAQGSDRKEAMRLAAKDRGLSRRDVYSALLKGSGEA